MVSRFLTGGVAMMAAVGIVDPLQAELYRYTDDDGNVVFTDRVPPEKSQREWRVYNEQGRVVEVIKAPMTEEELAEEARLARLEEERREREAQRARRDRNLLQTFTSLQSIEEARQDRVSIIESNLLILEQKVGNLDAKIAELEAKKQWYRDEGREVPQWLEDQFDSAQSQKSTTLELIDSRQREKVTINERFDRDYRRYQELKSQEN